MKDFKNGDHTITLIRTENGKTIQIQHDVVSPRPYSRMYQLTGTKGFANKYPVSGYALKPTQVSEDVMPDHENLNSHGFVPEDVKEGFDGEIQAPDPGGTGGASQESRRARGDGFYHGLSSGVLLAERAAVGHGCL